MDRRTFLAAAAAAPFALGSRPAAARGPAALALVTADLEARVVAVDAGAGRVVGDVATAAGPRSIETVGGRAVVAHTAAGLVSLLDRLRVRAVVRGFDAPRYTAADPGGRFAYVTDSGREEVVVLDVLRAEVVSRLALGGPARHVSLDRTRGELWVALGSKAHEIAVVDVRVPARPRLVVRIEPPFLAHDVGVAPRGGVWVTSGDRGAIALYDARRRSVRARLAADAPPQHVTFSGGRAYVTSGDDGTLRVHDAADGRALGLTRVPVGSYNVQQGAGVVTTPSLERGTLCVLDRGGRVEHELRVARSSHDACLVS
jgi:DNA-binding beta-propeller fold protein YncE